MPDRARRMSRRAWLAILPAVAVLRPSAARGQRAKTPARLGWLSYIGNPDPGLEGVREGLREIGHVEGKSFVIVPRFAEGDFKRLPRLVEELGHENLDVVVSARRGPTRCWSSRTP